MFWALYCATSSSSIGCCFSSLKGAKLRSYNEFEAQKWRQLGLQASSGIATLALTYTLLGICLGIGGLSDANLSPDTINQVIADLTAQFSTAFMSSVIGLPISAAMRTILIISMAAPSSGVNCCNQNQFRLEKKT